MKITILLSLSLVMIFATPVMTRADSVDDDIIPAVSQVEPEVRVAYTDPVVEQRPSERYVSDGYAAVFEILILRPLGFASLVGGTALFVGMSPLTALASIPAPHDAFPKTAELLVVTPARYTFVRPIGDYYFVSEQY